MEIHLDGNWGERISSDTTILCLLRQYNHNDSGNVCHSNNRQPNATRVFYQLFWLYIHTIPHSYEHSFRSHVNILFNILSPTIFIFRQQQQKNGIYCKKRSTKSAIWTSKQTSSPREGVDISGEKTEKVQQLNKMKNSCFALQLFSSSMLWHPIRLGHHYPVPASYLCHNYPLIHSFSKRHEFIVLVVG